MSKIEYKTKTIIETTTTTSTKGGPSKVTKTTKVVYHDPIIFYDENEVNNTKHPKVTRSSKRHFTTGEAYLGVPRMVQIINQNEQIKQKMSQSPWKYPQKIKIDPKKPSKLKNLYYSQFHLKK